MALTKVVTQDKIEIVGEFKHVQVRTCAKVLEDGVELSSGYHRHVVSAGDDYSAESAEVQAICAAVHTDAVVAAYAAHVAASALGEQPMTKARENSDYTGLQGDLALKAPIASPSFTGTATTNKLTLNHLGTDNFATIEGPLNRSLRFDLRDNGTSDSFEFRNAAEDSLLKISSVGRVTKPNQPAFRLTKTVAQTISQVSTENIVSFQTEVFDVNSNCTSGVFTAPVDGIYVLKFQARFDSPDRSAAYHDVRIITSGQAFKTLKDFGGYNSSSYEIMDNTIIAQMDAGDTATPVVYIAGGAGTQVISLDGTRTHFSGYLLG